MQIRQNKQIRANILDEKLDMLCLCEAPAAENSVLNVLPWEDSLLTTLLLLYLHIRHHRHHHHRHNHYRHHHNLEQLG